MARVSISSMVTICVTRYYDVDDATPTEENMVRVEEMFRKDLEADYGYVDFDSVEPLASAITPVPGGVGPMTIAMLMTNCVEAAEKYMIK